MGIAEESHDNDRIVDIKVLGEGKENLIISKFIHGRGGDLLALLTDWSRANLV